jgi:membrane protein YdbS with pleckstrin-like domain
LESLDPRIIPLQRFTGGIFVAVAGLAGLVFLGISSIAADDWPGWLAPVLLAVWLVVVLLGAWHAWRWPPIAYRHTSYRLDDQGIEIRTGVYWRVVINVPRSRVQHIDVSQGPLERRHGLSTLVIYTAGTEHAKVDLAGVEHGRALSVRESLLPSEPGDAV